MGIITISLQGVFQIGGKNIGLVYNQGIFSIYDTNSALRKENGKYQLNLWKANELVFLEAGIKPEHITMPGICTCCNPNFLFSHRASHGKRGNLAAFLGLRENQ